MTAGWFGLMLQPRDLAKLAYLYLHHARWDGRQIVPAACVTQSTADHVADPLHDCGYLWWLDRADGHAFMAGVHGHSPPSSPPRTSSPWSRRTCRQPSMQPR